MAFGINKEELNEWKQKVESGEIAFLTHYWLDDRFPEINSVTKVGCKDIHLLTMWGKKYSLDPKWIHHRSGYPHYDLMGKTQARILKAESLYEHIERFSVKRKSD